MLGARTRPEGARRCDGPADDADESTVSKGSESAAEEAAEAAIGSGPGRGDGVDAAVG